ncbi:JAB domain-containing protein [Haloplanus aerogenes]|uniref:DNA repair protein RadC n=1 Tax=Haloplanus aerogenes TaxID=660522 RepID=A0A3M0CZC4_9EURY|nr:JAB domain-containing protein [Haloplanus aerogenes]RMB12916.1 DNA repair protein RadC [Haloplanus aerogenes]
MEYELGSIQVTAELQDEDSEEIQSFSDVTSKYGFLRERPKEHFYAVFLKSDNEVIGDKLVSLGGASSASIDTKDVARTAVLTNASAVILVHNHPSTNDRPTDQDLKATKAIQDALDLFDVEVLDHVIISQTGSYSMKQNGDI